MVVKSKGLSGIAIFPQELSLNFSPFPGAASLQVEYPMLFRLENRKSARSTHCGVLEFIADEGMMYMPYWVSRRLLPYVDSCLMCLCLLTRIGRTSG